MTQVQNLGCSGAERTVSRYGGAFPERPARAARSRSWRWTIAQPKVDGRKQTVLHRRTMHFVPQNRQNCAAQQTYGTAQQGVGGLPAVCSPCWKEPQGLQCAHLICSFSSLCELDHKRVFVSQNDFLKKCSPEPSR